MSSSSFGLYKPAKERVGWHGLVFCDAIMVSSLCLLCQNMTIIVVLAKQRFEFEHSKRNAKSGAPNTSTVRVSGIL